MLRDKLPIVATLLQRGQSLLIVTNGIAVRNANQPKRTLLLHYLHPAQASTHDVPHNTPYLSLQDTGAESHTPFVSTRGGRVKNTPLH